MDGRTATVIIDMTWCEAVLGWRGYRSEARQASEKASVAPVRRRSITASGGCSCERVPPVAVQCRECSMYGKWHSPCLTQPSVVEGKVDEVELEATFDMLQPDSVAELHWLSLVFLCE